MGVTRRKCDRGCELVMIACKAYVSYTSLRRVYKFVTSQAYIFVTRYIRIYISRDLTTDKSDPSRLSKKINGLSLKASSPVQTLIWRRTSKANLLTKTIRKDLEETVVTYKSG